MAGHPTSYLFPWALLLCSSILSFVLGADGQLYGSQLPLDQNTPLSSDSKLPNTVFILTDDQDLHLNSLDYLPLIRKNLIDQATLFTKHFCTTAICCPAGWTGSDFLLDPFTYVYLNATFQRNRNPQVSYEGQYTTDVLAEKALGFLEEAVESGKPFFLGIAPVAPHSNVNFTDDIDFDDPNDIPLDGGPVAFTPPIPAGRHAHLF
ncbi:hypothetical protein VTO42DRAFT_2834 [Malbranchea cinnamomea]